MRLSNLPPGVTDSDIEEQAGAMRDVRPRHPEDARAVVQVDHVGTDGSDAVMTALAFFLGVMAGIFIMEIVSINRGEE